MSDRMKNLWQHRGRLAGILGGVLLSTAIGWILSQWSLGDGLVAKSYDLPFAFRPFVVPREAVLVYLDDSSYAQLHQSYLKAWDRSFFTRLLKRLTAEKAKAVVFDIVFSDALDPKIDRDFADAMQENGNVILASDWTLNDYGGRLRRKFTNPLPLFNQSAADVGASSLFPEAGEYMRKYKPNVPNPESPYGMTFSEAWVAAELVDSSFKERTNLFSHFFWLNYYAPEQLMPAVSFYKALDEQDPDVPPGFFKDKVVFVGAKIQTHLAAERKDEYSTPFSDRDDHKWAAGVTIHATAFLNLLRGDYLRRAYSVEPFLMAGFGILFGTLFVLLRPVTATVAALLAAYPIYYADYYAFAHYHYWFPWLIVLVAQIPAALVWGVAYNSLQLYRDKIRVEQTLGLYLTPKLVKKFAKDPALLRPGAKKQPLTILFTDIANFTSITEGMDPDELAPLMNQYFQNAVQNCIFPTDGTVVKYIGDAIFAFWNAPDNQDDHAFRACDAALRFSQLQIQQVNGHDLITRLGLHTGLANVGNFGSESRVDYTAIGENINLSSRMEGLNKYLGTRVLMTGETQREAGDRLVTRYLGLFRLKGFEKTVAVHELIGMAGEDNGLAGELRTPFACALDLFAKREFAAAAEAFQRVLKVNPKDGPSLFYLEQIAELREVKLPPEWKGEITLKDK